MKIKGSILLDTNLLLLLVVGLAARRLVATHERLRSDYNEADFDTLCALISAFDGIVFLTPILVEVDYFANQTKGSDRYMVLSRLRGFVNSAIEYPVLGERGVNSRDFSRLGFVDSTILEVLSESSNVGLDLTLASNDSLLVNLALARSLSAVLFSELLSA